jgi:hypothetical protein
MALPPRYPRASTPVPTVPPPLPELEPIAKRLTIVHGLIGLAVTLVLAGGAWATWTHGVVRIEQLDQVRTGAAAALTTAQAGTAAQLGALQATVQDLRAHQAGVDVSLSALTTDVARLNGTADQLYLQLVEIARATGARQVPASAATSSRTTRPP